MMIKHPLYAAPFSAAVSLWEKSNNVLDFFLKLAIVNHSIKAIVLSQAGFILGEISICQSGTLKYETLTNFL